VGTRLMKELEGAIAAPSIQGMNEKQIRQIVEESEADVIIHTAAISDVGICEKNPEESYYANVLLPVYLAKASVSVQIRCTVAARATDHIGRMRQNLRISMERINWKWNSGCWTDSRILCCCGQNGCMTTFHREAIIY
jgi:UDP-glucose 4-epimerase